ncbi:hypothetical protein GA0061105_105210 [Rhizobium aethiopicum]|uniref:Uncharacterized protein n=1 Tax=Rhizobium aethiopicum TaxID=1138170 RepID=A0A1C3Y2T7_9HYPH|nr:hypothetical protein GA0061105_105210 [Rhizobium aethiopicum]
MLDSQSIHLKALNSTDLHHLQTVVNVICGEARKPLSAPEMQVIAALLIRLYRHGVTEEEKLLSVGRLALTQPGRLSRPIRQDEEQPMNDDEKARADVEGTDRKTSDARKNPPAGPHAKDHLTDQSKTPGAGSLPEADEKSTMPGSG